MFKKGLSIIIIVLISHTIVNAEDITHLVVKGDVLGKISEKYKVPKDSIIKWNNIKKDQIKIGQKLIVGKNDIEQIPSNEDNESVQESTAVQNRHEKRKTNSSSLWWLWFLFGCIVGIIITVLWLKNRKVLFPSKKEIFANEDSIKKLKEDNLKLRNEYDRIKSENLKTISIEQVKNIVQKQYHINTDFALFINKLTNTDFKKEYGLNLSKSKSDTNERNTQVKSEIIYTDCIVDGLFNRIVETADSETIFEMHLKNNYTSEFTLYKAAIELVIQRPEFLDETCCDKQVIGHSNLEIKAPGEAQLQANGKWKVIKKMEVIIK